MKIFATTLCVIGAALALSACNTTTSYDAGANYATGRTAGNVDTMASTSEAKTERVFRQVQSK